MTIKKFLTFACFVIINLACVSNSNSIEPDVFVQSTVNRASQVLGNNLSKDQKIEKLKTIAEEKTNHSKNYSSIKDYVLEYKSYQEKITSIMGA